MLAQLLEQAGNHTLQLPSSALSDEILARLAEENETVICVSSLPPFAFAETRALCQRVRQRLPRNRIMVGLWDPALDAERIRERLSTCRPDRVVTNLGPCGRSGPRVAGTFCRDGTSVLKPALKPSLLIGAC